MTRALQCIFNKFKEHIVSLTENRDEFDRYIECADPSRRRGLFSRKRVWTFGRTVQAILGCFKESLPVEVERFLVGQGLPLTTPEAYIKRRSLVSSSLFRDLNTWLLHTAKGERVIKQWRKGVYLCGIDGTRLSLPYTRELYATYRRRTDKGYNLARGVFVTDLINRTVVAADMLPDTTEERKAALSLLSGHEFPYGLKSTVFVMDRGYPSLQLMNWFHDNTAGFVIRARRDSNKAIAEFMDSPRTSAVVTLELSPNRHDLGYPRPGPIEVRLVKRGHLGNGGQPVVLITDLDKDDFPDGDILEAYRARWNTETEIGTQKNGLQVEMFSGIRDICILQDFFASLILYNMESIIRIPCNERLATRKGGHRLQVDMNCTWELTLSLVVLIYRPEKIFDRELTFIVKMFLRNRSPVRPGRSEPRKRRVIKLEGKYITLTNYKRGL